MLADGPDPNAASMPTALAGLVFGLDLAHGHQPELYTAYVPALIDLNTHKLHIATRPHSRWTRQTVADSLTAAAHMTTRELLVEAVAINMSTLARSDATHALLFGEWELSNLLPALFKRADLKWCQVRLGWHSPDIAKKMRDVQRIMTPPACRYAGYMRSHPSAAFRLYALGLLQFTEAKCAFCNHEKAPSKCSGCGKRRYCNQHCQGRHWQSVHRAECEQLRRHTYLSFETSLLLADV